MTSKVKQKFKTGEWIVHQYHGVGEIKGILEKGLNEDRKTFYKIKTKKNTYWLPVGAEDSDRIEPLRNKKDFKHALKILAEKPEKIAKSHKSRKKLIHERWKDCDLESRASLLRDLNGRLNRKHLNFDERQTYKRVRGQFIDEWLLVDPSLSQKEAQKAIQQALKESIRKAPHEE